jgi:hypothetical protein
MIKGLMLEKNKTLKKIVYTANFSLEKQVHSIKYSLKKNFKEESFSINILGNTFYGSKYNNFLFLEKVQFNKKNESLKIVDIYEGNFIFWIINRLLENKIHRNFVVHLKKNEIIIKDILFKKEKIIKIETHFHKEEKTFSFDSRFISFFKLNKKTMNGKSKFIITNEGYGLFFTRKKRDFLFFKYS